MDENETEEHRSGPPFAGETSIPRDIDLSPLEGVLDDLPKRPTPEMRELAGRMALDEAAEGNYADAAELKAFAESLPAMSPGPGQGGPVVGAALEDIPAGGEGQMVIGIDSRIAKMLAKDAATNPVPELPRIARHIPVTAEQLGWSSSAELRAAVDKLEKAGYRVPEPPIVSRAAVEQALEADLERLKAAGDPDWDCTDKLATALVELGWVPGARRRADAVDEVAKVLRPGQLVREWGRADRSTERGIQYDVDGPLGYPLRLVVEEGELRLRQDRSSEAQEPDPDDRYEEAPVLDEDHETVIGHVWEVQPRYALTHPREWVAAVDGNVQNRPRFSSQEGAVGWVRLHKQRDGRPLTVPYDAEKVLGVKGEVVGWVWLDPEHAGNDGRWLAVHGSSPEHRHPLFGGTDGLDARNQAIGWVLERDGEARRG